MGKRYKYPQPPDDIKAKALLLDAEIYASTNFWAWRDLHDLTVYSPFSYDTPELALRSLITFRGRQNG